MRTMRGQKKLSASEEARLEKALIRLVGSTRRSRRTKNLIEVAKEVDVAEKLLGNRENVAKKIGLSEEMLREFASVNKLCKPVKQMIKEGRLTSVDVAYRLSMLPKAKQLKLARAYVENEVFAKEVRDVVALFKKNPKSEIQKIIEYVKTSMDIIQYVIKFRLDHKLSIKVLRQRFSKILGDENIVSLKVNDGIANLVVNEEGREILQKEAKKRGMSKRKLVRIVTEVRE